MRFLKIVTKIFIIIFLTLVSQIGGLLYLASELLIKRKSNRYRSKKIIFFSLLYLLFTLVIVPKIAPIFGREKIQNSDQITAHSFITTLLNRNYVTPELQTAIKQIAHNFRKIHPDIKLVYLDASFPFIDGFPLPPHLSHNDGNKIDISFIYMDSKNNLNNSKPSISGYGVFVAPTQKEHDQINFCKEKGYWQYSMAKYITLGTINNQLKLSEKATKDLLLTIVKQKQIGKIFIEPHLKDRLQLKHTKIRYHGCQAVRHDDHIHLQLK